MPTDRAGSRSLGDRLRSLRLRSRKSPDPAAATTMSAYTPSKSTAPADKSRKWSRKETKSRHAARAAEREAGGAGLPHDAGSYVLGQLIGVGATAMVFAATTTDGADVAVKRIDLDSAAAGDDAADRATREVRLHARFRHPHLLPLLAAFVAQPPRDASFDGGGTCSGDVAGCAPDPEAASGPELWLVTPRAAVSARALLEGPFPRGLPPRAVAAIVARVASALAYLHAARAVHRDVKAANVLIGPAGEVWLSDLGAANAGDLAPTVVPSRHASSTGARVVGIGGSRGTAGSRGSRLGSRRASGREPVGVLGSPVQRQGSARSRAAALGARVESAQYSAPELVAALSSSVPSTAAATPRPSVYRAAAAKLLQRYTTFAGTPAAMAPEVVEQSGAGYGPACDVYSLGVLALELASGQNPYASLPQDALYIAKLHGAPPDPAVAASALPPDAAALVAACVARDPAARPSADAVCAAPWVAGAAGRAGEAAVRAALDAAAAVGSVYGVSALSGENTPFSSGVLTPTSRGSSLRAVQSLFTRRSRSPDVLAPAMSGSSGGGGGGGAPSSLGTPLASLSAIPQSPRPASSTAAVAGTPPQRGRSRSLDSGASVPAPTAPGSPAWTEAALWAALAPRLAAAAGPEGRISLEQVLVCRPARPSDPDGTPPCGGVHLPCLHAARGLAVIGPDCATSGPFGRRKGGGPIGVALFRVPLDSTLADAPPDDASHALLPPRDAWAGPLLFTVSTKAPSEGGRLGDRRTSGDVRRSKDRLGLLPPAADPRAATVFVARTPRAAARLAAAVTAGGALVQEHLAPLDGLPATVCLCHGVAQAEYGPLAARYASARPDLTAAAHGGKGVDARALLAGRVPPPPAWRGVIHRVLEAERAVAARKAADAPPAASPPGLPPKSPRAGVSLPRPAAASPFAAAAAAAGKEEGGA